MIISAVVVLAAGATAVIFALQPGDSSDAPDPQQVLDESVDRIAGLDGATYQGAYFDSARGPVGLDVTGTRAGGISGTVTIYGVDADIRADDTGTYLRAGTDFWLGVAPGQAEVLAEKWVRAPDDLLDTDLTTVLAPEEFARIVACGDGSANAGAELASSDPVTVDGEQVWAVGAEGCGTIHVSVEKPHRVVRVEGASLDPDAANGESRGGGYVFGVGEVSKSDADEITTQIGDAATAAQDAPNPADPASLPPMYSVVGELPDTTGQCTESSCSIQVPVTNLYGPGEGSELSGQITGDSPDGAVLGTCTAAIPALGHQEQTSVTCTVTGSAWTSWVQSIPPGATGSYFWAIDVASPAWADSEAAAAQASSAVSQETIASVQGDYGAVGLEILSSATSGGLEDSAAIALMEQAATFGGLPSVRDLLASGLLLNPEELPNVVSAAASEFPGELRTVRAIEAAARLVGEGGQVQLLPGEVNLVDDAKQEVLAVVSQVEEDRQQFTDAVTAAFGSLGSSSFVAEGYTPVVAVVTEPYFTSLYTLDDTKDVAAQVKELGVTPEAFASGGALEIRNGNGSYRLTAKDLE